MKYNNTTAVFPGSFDPFTVGHQDVAFRALNIFPKLIIAIGENSLKKSFFSLQKKIEIIQNTFKNDNRISVCSYSGLTVDFCKQKSCNIIIRGIRNATDFYNEEIIAQANKYLENDIETIFLLSLPQHSYISSSLIREIYACKGNIDGLLPKGIIL